MITSLSFFLIQAKPHSTGLSVDEIKTTSVSHGPDQDQGIVTDSREETDCGTYNLLLCEIDS